MNSLVKNSREEKTHNDLCKFFKHFNQLEFPTDGLINRFARKCSIIEIHRNGFVFLEDKPCKKIFFLMEGEVNLICNINHIESGESTASNSQMFLSAAEKDLTKLEEWKKGSSMWNKKKVPLRTVTKGATLGIDSFNFGGIPMPYTYSSIATTNLVKLACISTDVPTDFIRILMNFARSPSFSDSEFGL